MSPADRPGPPLDGTSSGDDPSPVPDASADRVGGIAARLHVADGAAVVGDVFVLMAAEGSQESVRLFDETPFTHGNGTSDDAHESNLAANTTVEAITGTEIDVVDFTTAPGGGRSAGLTYAIGYLNMISGGSFTGGLRVAATGRLRTHGYVMPVNAIDEKTAAAHLADADVIFTPSTPTDHHRRMYGARVVGELFRAAHTGTPLRVERRLDNYTAWGTDPPPGMDIVQVRHLADVAAYLCGSGSNYACDITEVLGAASTEFEGDSHEIEHVAGDRPCASVR